MKFVFTPEEGQLLARAIARHYRRRQLKVATEASAWGDAPYRTTLLVIASHGHRILIECQGTPNYAGALKQLAAWLAASRRYAELYLATSSDATLRAGILEETRRDGIGLLVVDEQGNVVESQKARNPALVVTPDPTLKYGNCRDEVVGALTKFNDGDRKDSLRDMCELVERETERIAIAASKGGLLAIKEDKIRQMRWSDQINMLASDNSYNAGEHPILTADLKDDLHSFRGARNLIDHKVRNRRDEARRQRQYAERMMQGPRLVSELVSLRRSIK